MPNFLVFIPYEDFACVIDSGGLYGAEVMLVSLVSAQLEMGLQAVIGSIRKPGLPEKPIEKTARLRGIEVREFPMRTGVNLPGARRILHGFGDTILNYSSSDRVSFF